MNSKLFIFMFCMVFLVGTVSSLEFDDFKTYDEIEREYTITNYFGLGKEIGTVQLITPDFFNVAWGNQRIAEFEIKNGEFDYGNIIKGIELNDLKNNSRKIVRVVDYKYKTIIQVPKYSWVCGIDDGNNKTTETCTRFQDGTKDKVVWQDWTNETLLKRENITIGIYTDVRKGDTVEWIINVYGNERLTKWAIFNATIDVGLVTSYPTNESTGTTVNDFGTGGNNGITINMEDGDWGGSSLDFDGVDESVNMTGIAASLNGTDELTVAFNFTARNVSGGIQVIMADEYDSSFRPNFLVRMDNSTSLTQNAVAFGGDGICSGDGRNIAGGITFVDGESHTLVQVINTTGQWSWLDGNFTDFVACSTTGTYLDAYTEPKFGAEPRLTPIRFWNGSIGNVNIWNRSLSDAEAKEVTGIINGSIILPAIPKVTLNSPINAFNTTNQTIVFNGTVVDLDGIINVTLFIDGVLNETNSSGINDTEYLFTKELSLASHNWTFEACDNVTGCRTATTRTFSIVSFVENSQTFNSSSFETAQERFTINITTNGSTPSSAELIYNGTTFSSAAITSIGGNDFNISRAIIIPLVNETKPFFFNVTIDGTERSSLTQNQIINLTFLTLCNSVFATPFINYSFQDEIDLSVLNATIPTSTFTYWLGDGTVNKSLTFINNSLNYDYTFCAVPNRTLNVDYTFQYASTDFPQRIFGETTTWTNSTTERILYLLGSADGIFVTFQVINLAQQPITAVFVNASRIISSINTLIGSGNTGADGAITFWLNPDFLHTFYFVKTGFETLVTSLFPTQSSFTITLGSSGATNVSDYTRGINYTILPSTSIILINDTQYSFNFSLTSTFWTVTTFGFELKNSTGNLFNTTTASTNGGIVNVILNVENTTSDLIMDSFWIIDGNTTNVTSIWIVWNSAGTGWGLATFFTDLNSYVSLGLFGLDSFGLGIIGFLIIFMFTGTLSYKFGLTSPASIMGVLFSLTFLLDVGLGIFDNINPVSAVPNFPTIFVGIIFIGFVIKEVGR